MTSSLRRYNVRVIEAVLKKAPTFVPFPAGQDRAGWAELASQLTAKDKARLVTEAEADLEATVPLLPASLYFDFKRTGRRELFEVALRTRRHMLYRLALAECLEWQGRFIDKLSDIIWARCEETNWASPAHAHHGMDAPDTPTIDLAAASAALDLAEIDYLLGDKLDEALRVRIRHEVNRRCFAPYLERHDHWWLHALPERPLNNWTAVCTAGILGAACYLEKDVARLAEIMARGMFSLAEYLETFDPRGGSTEGPHYWCYGFGNYAVLSHLIEARTGGQIRPLDGDFIKEIAQFPMRAMLTPHHWVNFSDADLYEALYPGLLTFLSSRLDLPKLTGLHADPTLVVAGFSQFTWPLRQILWPLPEKRVSFSPSRHDWFEGMTWMVARFNPDDPNALQLAAKGGHNGEMHNQNDIGSIIVHLKGVSIVADPGRGRYSRAYFGPQRYEFLVASSLGHSVPVVNGHAQKPGHDFAAKVIDHAAGDDADSLHLDMTGAYPQEAGLQSLKRLVSLDRTARNGAVDIVEDYAFAAGPGRYESVLITTGEAIVGEKEVILVCDGVRARVGFDASELDVRLELHPNIERKNAPTTDITRVIFEPRTQAKQGRVMLRVEPV